MNKSHVGETVGIFTITELMPYKDIDGHALYKGICNDCGFERVARYYDLKASTKCIHIRIDGKVSFNLTNWENERIRIIFNGMKQRCYNKDDESYRWYGAKGIKIYDEWLDNPKSFEDWSLQNGYNDNLTIDRKDSKLDYCPDNCRWVTKESNSKYKSTTYLINVNGEIHSGKDWAKILGSGHNLINIYIRKYGLENTVEFIKRYIENPNLRPSNKNKSIYSLYMN